MELWDAHTGQEIVMLCGEQNLITSVNIVSDGKKLVVGSRNGAVPIYALEVTDWIDLAGKRLTRQFTAKECQKFLHQDSCP